MTQFFPATPQEIAHSLRATRRVRFEHWVREFLRRGARNGVAHRKYSTGLVIWRDGVAHVKYQGEVLPLRGTIYRLDDGTEGVCFLTLVERENNRLPALARVA